MLHLSIRMFDDNLIMMAALGLAVLAVGTTAWSGVWFARNNLVVRVFTQLVLKLLRGGNRSKALLLCHAAGQLRYAEFARELLMLELPRRKVKSLDASYREAPPSFGFDELVAEEIERVRRPHARRATRYGVLGVVAGIIAVGPSVAIALRTPLWPNFAFDTLPTIGQLATGTGIAGALGLAYCAWHWRAALAGLAYMGQTLGPALVPVEEIAEQDLEQMRRRT